MHPAQFHEPYLHVVRATYQKVQQVDQQTMMPLCRQEPIDPYLVITDGKKYLERQERPKRKPWNEQA